MSDTARAGLTPVAREDLHLLDYVRVLYKRRWTAGTAFLLVLLTATVYTFTATPLYEGRTRLLIESDTPNIVSFKEVIDEGQAKTDYYQTQYTILQSRALARRTLDTLKLWHSPHFRSPSREADAPAAGDETLAEARAIDAFLAALTITPIRNSRLVDVRFVSPDPGLAPLVANTLARSYIDQNLEYKFSASREATNWLEERLAEQRQQVERAEAALQQYREQNDAISMEDRQNIVVQKLTDLNAAVTKAKTERLQKEAVYRQIAAIEHRPAALDTFPAILNNQFIQQQKTELAALQRQQAQLGDKLGARHPEMIRVQSAIQSTQAKLQGEVAKVVQAVRTEYEAALAQERSLAMALDQQKAEALAMNRKSIEYTVLERDVETNRQVYEMLLKRSRETEVAGELKASSIRIVDPAEPPRAPVRPRKLLNLVLALLGGAILAVGLTFFFEYLDNRIKSPEEIRSHLGLAPIGLIPALGKKWSGSEPVISNGVPANFAEAFRTLRTNVLFSCAEEGSRTILVTSTGPSEGKTLTAANIAIGFAAAGQRVLLIDADMRRPRVHEVLREEQEPGLSNVLVGDVKVKDAVRQTDVSGLWLLAAGRIPPNPAELLASRRFTEFLQSVREHFDAIVLDSPPVMAVTDAAVIAPATTGVVFVVGADMTSRHAAREAVEQLAGGRARFLGAVLNRVDLESNRYYYSRYYRREYAAYYQAATSA